MGNFDEHLAAGKTAGLLAAVVGVLLALDSGGSIEEAFIVGAGSGGVLLLGSLLPDIDHQASIPRRVAGRMGVVTVVASLIALLIFAPDTVALLGRVVNALGMGGNPSTLGTGVLVVGAAALLVTGGETFDSVTTHRGFTHSYVFAGLVGLATLIGTQQLANFGGVFGVLRGWNGLLLAIAAAAGVLVHLSVDS